MSRWRLTWVRAVAVLGGLSLLYALLERGQTQFWSPPMLWISTTVLPQLLLGVFVSLRRPAHPQAVRLLLSATAESVGVAIESLIHRLYASPGSAPGSHFWIISIAYALVSWYSIVNTVGLFGFFPDGPPERRWMLRLYQLLWLTMLVPVLQLACEPRLRIDPYLDVPSGTTLASPFNIGWLHWLAPALDLITTTYAPIWFAPILLVLRYRVATAERRVLMRGLLYVIVVFTVMFLGAAAVNVLVPAPDWVKQAMLGGVSIGATLALTLCLAIGVLRHGLFDIDVVIHRSGTFALLWLGITTIYIAIAVAPGLALGGRIPVQVAVLVTIVVALAVQPLRRRLEALADRLVFGERINRYEVVQAFGAALEQNIDLPTLLPRLAETIRTGLRASWVQVTLHDTGSAAVAGTRSEGVSLTQDVRRDDEQLGLIECGPKDGTDGKDAGYDQADRDLLATLTAQAATAIANVRLATQLSERVEELARSRARIVTAADAERRRIERNIHDGAQQEVVALITKLRLARNRVQRGDSPAELLVELQTDARELLIDLRELAQGIHPPVLSDNGLVAAIEARAGRLAVPVSVRVDDALRARRLEDDIEGAAYFVVCEALSNVVKHARAHSTEIGLDLSDGQLRIRVEDDGDGITPANGATNGSARGTGLTNIRDRVETLGGQIVIDSEIDRGTRILAELPVTS